MSNDGENPAMLGWRDSIWFSRDAELSPDDTPLWMEPADTYMPLGPGGTYNVVAPVTFPLSHAFDEGTYFLIVETDTGVTQTETDDDNNTRASQAISITFPPLPDLTVTDIVWPPGQISDGDEVVLTATVENPGGAGVTEAFHVHFEVDGSYVGRQQVSEALVSGGAIQVSQNWIAEPGTHTLKVIVDEHNNVFESDDENNELSDTFPDILFPDLVVDHIAWLPTDISDGDSVTLTAVINNIGAGHTLRSFFVRFEVDGFVGLQEVAGGLDTEDPIQVSQTWTAAPGSHSVSVTVDDFDAVDESDEANNQLTADLPIIVDATPPEMVSLLPTNGAKVGGTVLLRAAAADNTGVMQYDFELSEDGIVWNPLGTSGNGELIWDTTALEERAYQIQVTARDTADNVSSPLAQTYVVDNTAPLPAELTAEPVEFGVRLLWTESEASDFAYYGLYRSTDSGGGYQQINGAMTKTSFLDSTAQLGATYYYVLTTLDHVGNESVYSNEASASPLNDSTAPTIIGLQPAEGFRSADVVHLSVTATDNVGVASHEFEYSSDGETWHSIASGASSSADWDVGALASGAYQVRVTVSDAVGNESSLVQNYGVDHDPPAAPENLRITADEVALVVAWDPVVTSDFHHYELYRSAGGEAFTPIVPQTTSTVYVDRSVEFGTNYTYHVIAVDDLGNQSPASEELTEQPLNDLSDPAMLTVHPPELTRVKDQFIISATATDNIEITLFRFEFAATGQETWTLVDEDTTPQQQFGNRWGGSVDWDVSELVEGDYVLRVTAVDYGGNTGSLDRIYVVDRQPPAEPAAPTVQDTREGNTLNLTWPAVTEPDLAGYGVYRSVTSSGEYVFAATAEDSSYVDTNLDNGTAYYYVVTAFDTAGNESAYSAESSGTPSAEMDLRIGAIDFNPTSPVLNLPASVVVSVENLGPADAAANVYLYDDDPQMDPISVHYIELPANTTDDVTFTWVPTNSGLHTITARWDNVVPNDVDPSNDALQRQVVVNLPPIAEAGIDREGDWNTAVGFDGTGSYDDDGLVVGYHWDFGDGKTSDHGVTSHAYAFPGTYAATLTITDNRGATAQDVCQVTVHDTRADLLVSDLTWTPLEPEEHDEVTITATIANVGNGPMLLGFFATFYIDGQYRGYERVNDLLQPNDTTEVTFNWTATKGLHTLSVVADDIQNNVVEIDEGNNEAGAALTLQQIYFPDLVVADLACPIADPSVSSEQPLMATAAVENRGTADALDFWVSLYRDDVLVTRRYVSQLVVEAREELSFEFQPTAGQHTLTVVADDPTSQVLESNEQNNARSLVLPQLMLDYPDLAVTNINVLPHETTLSDGTSFDISATIENLGNVAVEHRFQVGYYLDGTFIGSRELTYLAGKGSRILAMQTRATPGAHVAKVVIDEVQAIAESDEANNTASRDIPEITILYPDLIVSDVQWAPQDAKFGDTIAFTSTVSNTTVVSTLDTFVFELYLDGRRIAIQELPKLTGHSSQPFVLSWTADVDPTVGHTLRAVVDTKDTVHEEDETNNELIVADGTFHVGDNFILSVDMPGAFTEEWLDTLIYTSRQVAEFVATVTRGSLPDMPVGPGSGVEALITVIKKGNWYVNNQGELVQEPDEVIFEDEPMTFSTSDNTFRASVDLITFGTGNYDVRIKATDGVDTASQLLTMTVIEECNFALNTDKDVYLRGESVRITGNISTLSGEPVAFSDVQIMVSKGWSPFPGLETSRNFFDPTTRKFTTRTDVNGNIDFTFRPNWGDAGHFAVEAFVTARIIGTTGSTEFAILAADLIPSRLNVTTSKNHTYTKTFTLKNICDDILTNPQITLVDEDSGDNVTGLLSFTVPDQFSPGAKVPITLEVAVPEEAPDKACFRIVLDTDEGVHQESVINFTLLPAVPVPRIAPNEVKVGINPGGFHTETVTLSNAGMGTMRDITLLEPGILPWVSLVGLDAVEVGPGGSTTFDIIVAPPEDISLGTYADKIIASDGSAQAEMVLYVEVTSSDIGSVSFVLTNDAGQAVKNAEITIVSQEVFTAIYGDGLTATYNNIYYSKSDDQGVATLENVPIGDYDYSISAPGHEKAYGVLLVMPQSEAAIIPIVMTAVPLSYEWTVTPIIIEDTYEITLNLTYQAEIAKPKFVFLPPWICVPHEMETDYYDQVIIVNPSLIELCDVTVTVVGAEGITVSSYGQIGTMAAQSSTVLGYHVNPGDYEYLHGSSTYLLVAGSYVQFDPITMEPLEEMRAVKGVIPLVNPEPERVRTNWDGEEYEFFFPEGMMDLPFEFPAGLPEETVHEIARLEIKQTATLEREGFDARLELR